MNTILMDLPESVKGFTVRMFDENIGEDYYSVILNAKLNWEQQADAYLHEISHIDDGDFYSCESVDQIEWRAHKR